MDRDGVRTANRKVSRANEKAEFDRLNAIPFADRTEDEHRDHRVFMYKSLHLTNAAKDNFDNQYTTFRHQLQEHGVVEADLYSEPPADPTVDDPLSNALKLATGTVHTTRLTESLYVANLVDDWNEWDWSDYRNSDVASAEFYARLNTRVQDPQPTELTAADDETSQDVEMADVPSTSRSDAPSGSSTTRKRRRSRL
ncbi:hypothetical protein M3Y94_00490200 [Aphelenchoides besseyi]|nr:hypothetical protein M3Y94_00490200 [Aphelenchoides besseyi]